jgi:hypothetical protein
VYTRQMAGLHIGIVRVTETNSLILIVESYQLNSDDDEAYSNFCGHDE